MALIDEISAARQTIVKDGFDMSIGELIRIYEKKELLINPVYQRSFRWDESRKTRFIESLILGIPIPPIFVFTDEHGRWELIDGLQRLSTIFQFAGVLRNPESTELEPSFIPSGTKLIPSLNEVVWESEADTEEGLPLAVRLDVERVRIRVEILKRESDGRAKFELFQRLNSGGAELSPQESRNCVATMLNPDFFSALVNMSEYGPFRNTTLLTSRAIEEQKHVELVLRYLAYQYKPYQNGIDVHDWLDEVLIDMAQDPHFDLGEEENRFKKTFKLLDDLLGPDTFKRYEGGFVGGFSIASFEAITHGVATYSEQYSAMADKSQLTTKIQGMWSENQFIESTKAGTRGSTRLSKLLPFSIIWFAV